MNVKCIHEHTEWKMEKFKSMEPVFESYKCGIEENPVEFSFRGKIEDSKFNGAGKLRLGSK